MNLLPLIAALAFSQYTGTVGSGSNGAYSLSIVSATSALGNQGSNGTINVPTGTQIGDLLVATCCSSGDSSTQGVSSSGQTWTQRIITTQGTNVGRCSISTSPVGSALGAHTVTFTNGGSDRLAMTVLVMRGADLTSLTNTLAVSRTTNDTTATVSNVEASSYVISTVMQYPAGSNSNHTPTNGDTTEIIDQPDTSLLVSYATLRGTNKGFNAPGGSWATYTAGDPVRGAAIEIQQQ